MDRRYFLKAGTAAAGIALLPETLLAQGAGSGDAALAALFERIFEERVATSPELASSLGLDRGAARARSFPHREGAHRVAPRRSQNAVGAAAE